MKISYNLFWGTVIIAVITHVIAINMLPKTLMNVAFERVGAGRVNQWRLADRVTENSRAIVRPAPDFAYSACAFDLADGPVVIHVAPWEDYWSLSLYQSNSDNFFVLNDRESRQGGDIVLVRRGRGAPDDVAGRVVEAPSDRGIALIRRLAPTAESYAAAAAAARSDVCAALNAGS
ncbi:DUF1254 domain-containing protein [Terricaulis sp.]|uniref:DUF1254 domain-containing protein n=1 Tax=Terricaulis sp. TaxID=2768686 RepID=UPI00378439C9